MPLQIQEKARSCKIFDDLKIPGKTTAWLAEKVGEAEEKERKKEEAEAKAKMLEENERKRKLGEHESKS